jgi:ribosome-associated protein
MIPSIALLKEEVKYKTSRSGGKGGQSVNKVSTKVELNLDVQNSITLTDKQKEIIQLKLAARINNEGVLQIVSQKERSQLKNKKAVLAKLKELIEKAFFVQKKRRPTRVPRSVKEKRLKNKKRNSEIKKLRNKNSDE